MSGPVITPFAVHSTLPPRAAKPLRGLRQAGLKAVLGAGAVLAAGPAMACPEKVSTSEFAQQISVGDAAFADMDDATFVSSRGQVSRMLPCVEAGLTPGQAASFHRLMALGFFTDREHASAVNAFRSVIAVAPGYELPASLAPEGHPMRIYFEVAAGMSPGVPEALPQPKTGWVHVDGKPASEAPSDRPYVFQYFKEDGTLSSTQLVQPGLPIPNYPSVKTKDRSGGGVNVPLLATAGVAAVTSGGLFLAARGAEGQFWDPSTPSADLDALRAKANRLGAFSAGFGVVAIGAGAGAVFVGTW